MGKPVPPPGGHESVPPGELCESCWGLDGIFGNGPTPSLIIVEIDGVVEGPNWTPPDGIPPNGTYELPQFLLGGPCFFLLESVIILQVLFDIASTVVDGSILGGFSFFISNPTEKCILVVTSGLDDHFSGGTATVFIPGTD